MSPGNRNVGWWPQKLILIGIRVVGWVLVSTFLPCLAVVVFLNLSLEVFQHGFFWQKSGCGRVQGASVSILSSLSSSTTTSESCCWGPSLAMETSLTSQPSNHGEDRHGWESPLVEERLSCSSSSSCTWSSQVMGGDQATSIASLKAICWVSAFFDISLHSGQGGVGNFQPQELDES